MAKKKPIGKVKQRAIADETYLPKPYIPPIVETLPGITVNAKAKPKPKPQEDYVNYPWKHIEYLPEVTIQAKTKSKYKNLPNVSVSSKKTPIIKQAVESSAIQQYNPITKKITSTANPGQTKSQIKQSTSNIKGDTMKDMARDITAVTQFIPSPYVSIPSSIINSAIGMSDARDAHKKGDILNETINTGGAFPWRYYFGPKYGTAMEAVSSMADLTDNFGLEQKKNGGWLDNYGEEANANEGNSSAPKEWMGEGYSNVGRDYSPAWGGQFAMGGSLPGATGFMYARTGAPSNGPYAKKTLPSAQNGQEMSYYQNGLDWKPKSISRDGSVIKDNNGYWNPDNWGKVVEIDSPDITMQGVDQDLIGISDEGDVKYMTPGKNYKFKGKKVKEYPVGKNGVNQQDEKVDEQLDQLTNFTNYNKPTIGGWLDKY